MRHVKLDHVEAGLFRHASGADEVAQHPVHVGTVHRARHLAVRQIRNRRRRDDRPGAVVQGLVSPSQARFVAPLRPAWASWRQIRAELLAWTNSTISAHAVTCSGLYMPAQPGEIRPSRSTSDISVNTSPAPPIARLPRWTR